MSLSLNVLGRTEIAWQGQVPAALTLRKSQLLLIYLAVKAGPHDRSHLAGLLWGDLPEKSARRNLRHALHRLRQALAPQLLESDRLSVDLNPDLPCRVDALEFEGALAHARRHQRAGELQGAIDHLEAAGDLYRGDFLADFDLVDCLEFEEWAAGCRAHLRVRFLEALDTLVAHWTRRGAYERALHHARRQLEMEPLWERSHRQMMRLLALTGRRSAALAQYRTCCSILAEELGLEPLEETCLLYAAIQRSALTPSDASPPPEMRSPARLPFVGREEEHGVLVDWWEAAWRGGGELALVEGEAGVGKTRLLEEVLRYAETQGAKVLQGRCYEFGATLPYQPIAEALRTHFRTERLELSPIWLAELARLLPDLHERHPDLPPPQRAAGEAARQRLFEAVARLLRSISDATASLCLFLDDLHWADQATLDLLHYLVRHLEGAPIGLVGTYRPEETALSHPLTRLRQGLGRDHLVVRLALAPLSGAAVEALARALVGARDGDALGDLLYRESEGNAFILAETVSALQDEGVLVASGVSALHDADDHPAWAWTRAPVAAPLPLSVQDIVLQRVGRLSDAAQRLLTLAAVAGQHFDLALLQGAAEQDGERVEESLDEWLARRLVRPRHPATHREYDFSHDKIRAVVYRTTRLERRRRLHRRVGEALERRFDARIEEHDPSLAYHFERAGVVEKALVYLPLAAAQAAAVYANEQALDYHRRALALCPPSDGRRWRVLLQQADVLSLVGRYEAASAACREVLDGGDAGWQARAYGSLAQIYRVQRDYATARRYAEKSARLACAGDGAGALSLEQQRAQTLQTLGEIERAQSNLVRARERFEAALAIHEEVRDDRGLANCYLGLGDILSAQGRYEEARRRYEEAVILFRGVGDRQRTALSLRSMGMAGWRLREYDAARRAALESLEICRAIGDRRGEAASLNNLGLVAIVQGDHPETQRTLRASIALYRELGLERRTARALHNLGISYMECGDFAASRESLEQALEINRAAGTRRDQALDLGWLGKLAWLCRDYAAAVDHLERALALDEEIGGGEEEDWHLIWRASAACASGDLEGAEHYLRRAERAVAAGGANLKAYEVTRWQAALHLASGDLPRARSLAQQALTAAETDGAAAATLGALHTLLAQALGAAPSADDGSARRHFERALALLPDAVPTVYPRALALHHYGEYLTQNGSPARGAACLEEARALFTRLGLDGPRGDPFLP